MQYKSNIFLIAFFFSLDLISQINIKGTVKNELAEAIEFANVALINSNGSIVNGGVTDNQGNFSLTLKEGNYKLVVSFVGYNDLEKNIVVNQSKNLGILILKNSVNQLKEVLITAKKPTVTKKIDRLQFTIKNTILSEGNAWEVLSKTPGVITSSSGLLQIFGKSGILVMINERPVQLSSGELKNMLENMPANEINLIEVITNPSAKYDAEGNGIINISMNKEKKSGYSGSINSSFTQGVFPKTSNGVNLSFRNEKLDIATSYSLGVGKRNVKENSTINFLDVNKNTFQKWNENSNRNTDYLFHNFRTALDYQLSKRNSLSFNLEGYLSPKQETLNQTKTDVFNNQNTLSSYFNTHNNLDKDIKNISYNLNYIQKFAKKNQTLTINLDYVDYENNGHQNVNTDFYTNNNNFNKNDFFTSDNTQDIKIYSSKLDFETPLDSTSFIETGLKSNAIKTDNNLTYFIKDNQNKLVFDPSRSNHFTYKENTYAAYVSYYKDFNRFNFKVGLRGEYTKTEGKSLTLNQTNTTDYFKVFPSAFFQYVFKNKNSIGISYSKRIKRPKYSLLNPFQFYSSPFSLIEGNPFLQPSFTDNIDITYTINNKYFLTGYISYIQTPFTQLSFQDNQTQVIKYQAVNLNNNVALGLVFSSSFSIYKFWRVYLDINMYNETFEFNNIDTNELIKKKQFNIDPNLWSEIQISKKENLSMEITAKYFSPKVQGGFSIKERSEVSIGVRKGLFNNKARLSLYVADLFNQNRFTLVSDYANQNHIFRENPENQYIRLSFSYKFGNQKAKKEKKKAKKSEEKQRL